AVTAIGGKIAETMGLLLEYAGAVGNVIDKLEKMKLPPRARKECDRLLEVASMIRDVSPELSLTIDPVENRGFEYHSGVSFSIFSRSERSELGWGGRYLAGDGGRGKEGGEPATGFTLFLDSVLRVVPEAVKPRRVFLAFDTSRENNDRLREEGWVVIQGLEMIKDVFAEARRMNCDHAYVDGELKAVD
ncbi:MAG: ATP phosphoribosyltransferase regulatory subunit, partial [Rhodospirillaceae bacterium]|nr:ATP phosphoribosyltransferase regulatory subunit [Rhodospirillaceae bacterium]